mmetsp:Transcript_7967/g.15991  ORF Transcript_7967/g.15991 Transcript_7967/m.15991 type:complete len:442 (-) Transcript_7967:641-1966(-)
MLDVKLFRVEDGGDPDKIRESQRRRFKDVEVVDRVIELDQEWRRLRFEMDGVNRDMNSTSKEIGRKMKAKELDGVDELKRKVTEMKAASAVLQERMTEMERRRDELIRSIGNVVHPSVPVNNDEDKNAVEFSWGEPGSAPGAGRNHVDLLYMIDGVDYDRGTVVAGSRGFFLKGPGALLNMAIIQYGLQFISRKGFTPIQTPYMMNKEAMARCAQLSDFDEQLYKVSGDGDKYLIATSEQPLCGFFTNDWIDPKALPIKYCGYSTCFRKEAGAHGRDTLGIFRVHQFEKLEQFVVTSPEEDASWHMHQDMIENAMEFYRSLKIPYRVVNIVSGALNDAAAKKYDLEGWFPSSQAFRELVSCSNCTDYQARRLETRWGTPKTGEREKKYVHMLNSTLCATTRVICAILENYQTDEGIRVPDVLQSHFGSDFIPFVRPSPVLK